MFKFIYQPNAITFICFSGENYGKSGDNSLLDIKSDTF